MVFIRFEQLLEDVRRVTMLEGDFMRQDTRYLDPPSLTRQEYPPEASPR